MTRVGVLQRASAPIERLRRLFVVVVMVVFGTAIGAVLCIACDRLSGVRNHEQQRSERRCAHGDEPKHQPSRQEAAEAPGSVNRLHVRAVKGKEYADADAYSANVSAVHG